MTSHKPLQQSVGQVGCSATYLCLFLLSALGHQPFLGKSQWAWGVGLVGGTWYFSIESQLGKPGNRTQQATAENLWLRRPAEGRQQQGLKWDGEVQEA